MKIASNQNAHEIIVSLAIREIEYTNFHLEIQRDLNSKIRISLKCLTESLDAPLSTLSLDTSKSCRVLNILSKILAKSNSNIEFLENIVQKLQDIANSPSGFSNDESDFIKHFYAENARHFDDLLSSSVIMENYLESNCSSFIDDKEAISEKIKRYKYNLIPNSIPLDDGLVDKTLIISDDIIILPYTARDLYIEMQENPEKYHCMKDVVDSIYTKPTSYYSHAAISRFKESFKLAKRSNISFKESLDLAIETFLNYSLHPAIITACKNLNELDIYLSCLEYNELEDFRFFKIEFNLSPSKTSTLFKSFKKVEKLNRNTTAESTEKK